MNITSKYLHIKCKVFLICNALTFHLIQETLLFTQVLLEKTVKNIISSSVAWSKKVETFRP